MIEMGNFLIKLVIPAGFEPTACRLGGDRSILLSYGTILSKVLICKAFEASAITHREAGDDFC